MVKTLQLGAMASRIERASAHLVRLEHDAESDGPSNDAAAVDPRAAACRALAEPLDFPPFSAATVPGDHVAIGVDAAVPNIAGIVQGTVDALVEAGVERDAISIVSSEPRVRELCRAELGDAAESIQFVIHDPDDPNDLCFLGVTHKQRPLRINRTIFEADVVLPIGVARLAGIGGGGGVYDSLYPRFSDRETMGRFRTPAGLDTAAGQAAARRETDEAGWLLGVPMVMLVVPGIGGNVAEVVAGEARAVAQHAQRACQRNWSFHVANRASLVVATVTGGPLEQTWDNVARALAAAERLVADDGAVAVCSELDLPPGKSLGRLVGSADFESVERKARTDHAADSWPTWQLARALQRGPVYFLSHLADETVEDMGLAPVADVEDLVRLAGRHESCIVLDNSQHTLVTVNGEG